MTQRTARRILRTLLDFGALLGVGLLASPYGMWSMLGAMFLQGMYAMWCFADGHTA